MLRSVGAIIFGIASDRYGRKWPFVINNILFIILELVSPSQPPIIPSETAFQVLTYSGNWLLSNIQTVPRLQSTFRHRNGRSVRKRSGNSTRRLPGSCSRPYLWHASTRICIWLSPCHSFCSWTCQYDTTWLASIVLVWGMSTDFNHYFQIVLA
jgi:hypothetical protein